MEVAEMHADQIATIVPDTEEHDCMEEGCGRKLIRYDMMWFLVCATHQSVVRTYSERDQRPYIRQPHAELKAQVLQHLASRHQHASIDGDSV